MAVSTMMFPFQTLAQATRAGVVTTLEGSATVARTRAPQPAPLRFKDDVFVQDRIVTAESSTVRILLGGKAVITVRERSILTISETAATSTVDVAAGKIALAVAKDRMKPGESVEIKTPNAVAGVRGTVVIAEVSPASNGARQGGTSQFTLLTGIIDVSLLDPATGRPGSHRVTLNPLQRISATGQLGAVRAISQGEAQRIAADYKVSLPTPPPAANVQVTERQVEQALKHSAALTRSDGGRGDKNGGQERSEEGADDSGQRGAGSERARDDSDRSDDDDGNGGRGDDSRARRELDEDLLGGRANGDSSRGGSGGGRDATAGGTGGGGGGGGIGGGGTGGGSTGGGIGGSGGIGGGTGGPRHGTGDDGRHRRDRKDRRG